MRLLRRRHGDVSDAVRVRRHRARHAPTGARERDDAPECGLDAAAAARGDCGPDDHKYLIHDRDSIFARHLDDSIRALGLAVLRSPFSSPKANAICERVIGTIRRECLDWMIPAVRGASPLDPARVGCPLQRRASAQRTGTRRSRPSRRICARPEVRIPTSMDAGCARASEIRAGRTAPRVLAFGDAGGRVGRCWASAPMTNAGRMEFLRSTAIAGPLWRPSGLVNHSK